MSEALRASDIAPDFAAGDGHALFEVLTRMLAEGLDTAAALEQAGLPPDLHEMPGVRISGESQVAFLHLASKALADDLVGFRAATACDLRRVGLLYYALASADTLGDAFAVALRQASSLGDVVSLEVLTGDEPAIVTELRGVPRDSDRHLTEFWLTLILRMARKLTGHDIVPSHAEFAHARSRSSRMDAFFGRRVLFGAKRDRLCFTPDSLSLPLLDADAVLHRLLVAKHTSDFPSDPTTNGLRQRVDALIASRLRTPPVRLGDVARDLGMSERTLSRRLETAGESFGEALVRVRRELADRHLRDPSLPISTIAWMVGFTEVSSFTRAYRRWTGSSPSAARERLSQFRKD